MKDAIRRLVELGLKVKAKYDYVLWTEILRQAQYAQASAGTDDLPTTGHIPLPKRRPVPRP
jgi:hypothetical protein